MTQFKTFLVYGLLSLAALITLSKAVDSRVLDLIFVGCGLLAYALNRNESNITSLIFILITLRCWEIILWSTLDMRNAYIGYPMIMLLDLTALYLIYNRNRLLAWREYHKTGQVTPHKYVYTNADYTLGLIYKCYLLITVLCFVEHFFRHTDHIGLPPAWSTPELLFFYDLSSPVKRVLNTFEFIAIMATAHHMMRTERIVQA
ncbi:MAG: hypothetical protein GJ680_14620 [Alteromonadaceae bacterium]|nr:hypothetical protein [Alteromonadaceae bacterium]